MANNNSNLNQWDKNKFIPKLNPNIKVQTTTYPINPPLDFNDWINGIFVQVNEFRFKNKNKDQKLSK